jgi:3',5'-cyclic AMP phosphodiesterase CpdA
MDDSHRIRILHLSDLHARVALPWMDPKRQRLIRSQKAMRERVLGASFTDALVEIASNAPVDILCFTGDVADWGLQEEYEQASDVLERILEALKLDRSRLFVVPGNHDVKRATAAADWSLLHQLLAEREDVVAKLGSWALDSQDPPGVDAALLARVIDRQSLFWGWTRDVLKRGELVPGATNANHPTLGYRVTLAEGLWPFPVHVIGLNSAWLCGEPNEKGKLAVTREQVDWLCRDANGKPLPGFRLVLMHHALGDLADMDAAEVQRTLADNGADLLLHGHQHDARLEMRIDPDRSLNVVAAGSLYEGEKGDRFFNGFHVIDVWLQSTGRHPRYDVTFYGWSANGYWHRTNAVYRQTQDGKLHWPAANPPLQSASTPAADAADALRRAWHPPGSFDNRGSLAAVAFTINPSYQRDGEHRWQKYSDVLVSLEKPATLDDIYLIPSRRSPKRFHEPRKIQKRGNRSAKSRLIQQFVESVGTRYLEGLCFKMTMRSDGRERMHVYAKELDDFLNANAAHEERSVVYISYKKEDNDWRIRLRKILDADERLEVWDDSKLKAGDNFRKKMTEMVARTKVMIVLASPEYLVAPLPVELELTPAIAAANVGDLTVLWVPIRPFDYRSSVLDPFMAPVNPDAPLEAMTKPDWLRAMNALYQAVCEVLHLKPLPSPKPDVLTDLVEKYRNI